MPEILTESFCERCGTRYTFEATAPVKAKKLGRFKTLSKGLKNYVLSDETSMDEAMAAARSDEEREATSQQLEAFQSTFNFCMTCRQYTCANCWNSAEGACLTCAPLNGYVTPSTTFLDLSSVDPIEPLGVETSPWPTFGESREPVVAEAATPWPDEAAADATPTVVAEVHVEPAELATEATAWPIEAELAATASATPESLPEPDPITIDAAPVAEPAIAEPEVTAALDAADWAMAEAEASVEADPEAVDDVPAVYEMLVAAESEPEPEPAEVAAEIVDRVAIEPERPAAETFAFESDIAPAIAELPDTDLRAADAARRTSDLLARLRPAASTPVEAPIVETVAASTPVAEPLPVEAEFTFGEFDVADLIGDSQAADVAREEAVAVAPAPDEAADALPADLLAIIGLPIEAEPEPAEAEAEPVVELVAEPVEVVAEAEPEPVVELVAEPVEVAAEAAPEPPVEIAAEPIDVAPAELAAQAAPSEPTDLSVAPEPEPVRADVVEQPTWRIVAPDPTAPPTNGHTPHPEPIQPAVVAKAPVEPAPPVEPQWPTPPAPVPLPDAPYLVSRRNSDASEGLWAASARGVVAQTPGAPVLAVQTCGSCGLSLSATARFCRRCGTRQGA